MAPRSKFSEQSAEDIVRRTRSYQSTTYEIRGLSPESERKRKMVDPTDLSKVGARFEDTVNQHPYWPQIDAEDLKTTINISEAGPPTIQQPEGYFDRSPQGTAPTTPRNDRTTRHTNSLPYLLPSDIPQMYQSRRSRRSASRRTGSSVQDSSSSEYLSAIDMPLSPRTDGTEDEDADERRSGSQRSLYYTPSRNTPSHRSEGSRDGSVYEGHAPESPNPWSPYTARYDQEE